MDPLAEPKTYLVKDGLRYILDPNRKMYLWREELGNNLPTIMMRLQIIGVTIDFIASCQLHSKEGRIWTTIFFLYLFFVALPIDHCHCKK